MQAYATRSHQAKGLASKTEDLILILSLHMMEGEIQLPHVMNGAG